MLRKAMMFSLLVTCLGFVVLAQAQETMMHPPKVLVITREVVKPGKSAAHAKWEAGYPRALAKANWKEHYIAATALTGESRALFFFGYDSMAAWESDFQAAGKNATLSAETDALDDKDGDFLSESRTGVFTYMPELSYNPDVPIAGTRYFGVFSIHVKPGHGEHFVEVRKIARDAHIKAGLKDHYAVFQMRAGGPGTHYLIFLPMQSLAELDQFAEVHGKAYREAMGEEGQKKMDDFDAQGIESSELNIIMLNPKMSYVPKEWKDADPEFWAPKPAAAAKTAPKEEPKKK